MHRILGLSHLRFKKVGELMKFQFGVYHCRKNGEIRFGKNMFDYIFHPRRTSLLEFCYNDLVKTFKVNIKSSYGIDQIIDIAYSNFVLGEYNLAETGADFKFNTVRNVFKYAFKTRDYVINHYSHKLSLPVIQFLREEFSDRDYLNIILPTKVSVAVWFREFETGIIDHVRKEFSLLRAGPIHIRSPLTLVA
jgi:hypothetical protein